jgi:transmembrane protein
MNNAVQHFLRRPATALAARVTLTLPFWLSGLSKLIDFPGGVAEMAHFELEPAVLFNVATIITQIGASALIISGRYVWLGAGVLGVFTALTVPLVHHFWSMADEPFRTIAFHTATEHVGMIGGLIGIAVLSARTTEDGRRAA